MCLPSGLHSPLTF
jgi:hypothetical protein